MIVAVWGVLLDRFTLKRVRVVVLMGFAGMLAIPFAADTVIARFNDDHNQASNETREVMNEASKAMVADSAIGLGWNNFALTINPPWPYGDVIDEWERNRGHRVDPDYKKGVVESHYWLLLAETGWPGFVTYMLFIGLASAVLFWRWIRSRGTPGGAYVMGLLVALTLLYLHSNLERVLTQTKNLSAYMIFLGAALSYRRPSEVTSHARTDDTAS